MKKKNIVIFTLVLLLLLITLFVITYIIDLVYFSIALAVLFVLLLICFFIYIKSDNPYTTFIKKRNKILETYKDRIEKVDGIPSIKNDEIVIVDSIEDLIELNSKKILYKNDNDSCFFMNKDQNVYIYILKINENVISPTLELIKFMKNDEDEILYDLEKTIEYKLDELHSYKISPIRNTMAIKIIDGLEKDDKEKKDE